MGRKRRGRFRRAVDAQEQFDQIEKEQRRSRQDPSSKKIDSIEKSRRRAENARKRIRRRKELDQEYGLEE